MKVFSFALLLFLVSASALAQSRAPVASESRDASAAYILTQNFIIGRYANQCFTLVGRTDTPKSFEKAWQRRNTPYLNAAFKYMDQRLLEAQAKYGVVGRNQVASALNATISNNGMGAVDDALSKGDKTAACEKVITLIEKKIFDIDNRSPMFDELRALLTYADTL
jgi:hypothetical protein